jgi:hypothetical protein
VKDWTRGLLPAFLVDEKNDRWGQKHLEGLPLLTKWEGKEPSQAKARYA